MNQKQRQRLVRAIGSAILSGAALSLVAVDKVQAAVITYNFQVPDPAVTGDGFFKFDNSSLTGTGREELAVSEGKFYGFLAASRDIFLPPSSDYSQLTGGKDYYDLVGATVLFFEGEFRGLQARGSDRASRETTIPGTPLAAGLWPPIPGPIDVIYSRTTIWSIQTSGQESPGIGMWTSLFEGIDYTLIQDKQGRFGYRGRPVMSYSANVSYTLVDTATQPVPEPITVAGTALALAGLSWLKHKKKMAV